MSDRETSGFGGSDEELAGRAVADRDGPEGRRAAAELLARYRRPVYLWCFRYAGEHERALDLSQDVLARAWDKLGSFAGRSKFSSWLSAIARNRCLNEVRRVGLFDDGEVDLESVADARADPAREFEEREDERRLLDVVSAALDPLEQRALWMRCVERLPVDEITRLLGIEQASGARGVLQRARRKLKAALEEGGQP